MKQVLDFLKNEDGASALEYGVMIATLAAVIVAMVIQVGSQTNNTFARLNSTMSLPPFR